jgi:hypothetical protein
MNQIDQNSELVKNSNYPSKEELLDDFHYVIGTLRCSIEDIDDVLELYDDGCGQESEQELMESLREKRDDYMESLIKIVPKTNYVWCLNECMRNISNRSRPGMWNEIYPKGIELKFLRLDGKGIVIDIYNRVTENKST